MARKQRPAITPEARENQMIALAEQMAEKQLLEGTASAQVVVHYLKLGTTKARLENEKLRKRKRAPQGQDRSAAICQAG